MCERVKKVVGRRDWNTIIREKPLGYVPSCFQYIIYFNAITVLKHKKQLKLLKSSKDWSSCEMYKLARARRLTRMMAIVS